MIYSNFMGLKKDRVRIFIGCMISVITILVCDAASASVLDPHGPIAAAEKAHFIKITTLTMIAVLPVLVLVPILLWQYRYKNTKARYDANWDASKWLELVMWGVPIVITVMLSIQLWQNTKDLDPYKPIKSPLPPLHVQVVGLDWKWLFIYPEYGIASIGEMAFPAHRPVTLTLTSDTVMQSFMISSLAGQIYVMPGMKTQLNLIADDIGVFEGENTQFNGDGFAAQKFKAMAMSEESFNDWIANAKSQGITLNKRTYGVLGLRTNANEVHQTLGIALMPPGVVYFDTVSENLFDSVVARYHDGKAIDPVNQPGSAHYKTIPIDKKQTGSSTLNQQSDLQQ
jgi:cytochrome o ubiquinol oxidase subunit II